MTFYTPPSGGSLYFEKDDMIDLIAAIRGGDEISAMAVLQRAADQAGETAKHIFEQAKFSPRAGAR